MKLLDLLFVADVDRERFNVLRRRDQIPIIRGSADDADARQSSYTLADAYQVRVMLDLIGNADDQAAVPPALAISVVANIDHTLRREGLGHPLNVTGDDLWGGVLVIDEAGCPRSVARFAGPATDIPTFLARNTGGEFGLQPVRLILVNLSGAARFVRSRALERRLPEGGDHPELWVE